jgi:hypothetical protein
VEIDLAWAGRVVAFDDPDFGTVSDWGDVTLRTKLRLFQDRKQTSAVAVRYVVTLPETNQGKGLGPNTLRMMAQALATKALGSVALHVNAGLAIHDEVYTPHAQNDLFAYGVALEWSATGRLAVLGEVAGRAGKGLPVVERTHEARLGLRYSTPRVAFDAAVRRGLSDSDGDWGLTAGLTWTAKAPR